MVERFWSGATTVAVKESVAQLQAMILGGSVVPGCVIAEAVVVALLALVLVLAYSNGIL